MTILRKLWEFWPFVLGVGSVLSVIPNWEVETTLLIVLTGLLGVVAAIKGCRHLLSGLGPWELYPWPPEGGYPTYEEQAESDRHELLTVVYWMLSMVAFLVCGGLAIYG
jgi:hypothetical protein